MLDTNQPQQYLDELLEEPIIQSMMEVDGIASGDVIDMMANVRKKLIARRWHGTTTRRSIIENKTG